MVAGWIGVVGEGLREVRKGVDVVGVGGCVILS